MKGLTRWQLKAVKGIPRTRQIKSSRTKGIPLFSNMFAPVRLRVFSAPRWSSSVINTQDAPPRSVAAAAALLISDRAVGTSTSIVYMRFKNKTHMHGYAEYAFSCVCRRKSAYHVAKFSPFSAVFAGCWRTTTNPWAPLVGCLKEIKERKHWVWRSHFGQAPVWKVRPTTTGSSWRPRGAWAAGSVLHSRADGIMCANHLRGFKL